MKPRALPALNFPSHKFRIRDYQGRKEIFDTIRGQWVRLTPEEWVRQHLIAYLADEIKVPKGWISIERQHNKGRYDVAIFDWEGQQRAVFECKSPHTKLSENTLFQALRYIQKGQIYLLGITNGLHHFYWVRHPSSSSLRFVAEIPSFFPEWIKKPSAPTSSHHRLSE